MKALLAAVAASLLASGAAFAADEHDHSKPGAKPGASSMMHGHMRKMREQMAQIRATTDPKEKERLMQEHMKSMEQAMAGMDGMRCGKM